jgi:hypothetical protein
MVVSLQGMKQKLEAVFKYEWKPDYVISDGIYIFA